MFNAGCTRPADNNRTPSQRNLLLEQQEGSSKSVGIGLGGRDGDLAVGLEAVGSTALCLLFDGCNRFYCASIGDCRAVLCRGGKAIEISPKEHKATRADEIARIFLQGVRTGDEK